MEETEDAIMSILRDSALSLTPDEVSEKAGLSMPATLRCLDRLEARGLAEKRMPGGVMLYTVKGRKRGLV